MNNIRIMIVMLKYDANNYCSWLFCILSVGCVECLLFIAVPA